LQNRYVRISHSSFFVPASPTEAARSFVKQSGLTVSFNYAQHDPFVLFLHETRAGVILSIIKKTGDSVTASVSKNLAGLGISCNSNRPTPAELQGRCHSERSRRIWRGRFFLSLNNQTLSNPYPIDFSYSLTPQPTGSFNSAQDDPFVLFLHETQAGVILSIIKKNRG